MTGFLIFGDLNVDIVTARNLSIEFTEFAEIGGLVFSNLEISVGGSAFNFASRVLAQFQDTYGPVTICGAVGEDAMAEVLKNGIDHSGVRLEAQRIQGANSGCAIILWDAAGHRAVINNSPNANMQWAPEPDALLPLVDGCIVYLSGYCLIGDNPRALWWEKWFDHVKRRCSFLILDVVPHRIHHLVQSKKLLRYITEANLFVSEVSTLRRALEVGSSDETVTDLMVRETKDILLDRVGGPFILRYGESGCDEQMTCKASGDYEVMSTGYANDTKRVGYGDELLVKILKEFL